MVKVAETVLPVKRQKQAPKRCEDAEVVDGKVTLTGTTEQMERLNRVFGTCSKEFQSYALTTLLNLVKTDWSGGGSCLYEMELIAAQLEGIAPANEAEAMLAMQMVSANHLAGVMARKTMTASYIEQLQAYGNLTTKFQRTYLAQMEGLAKLRRGGKQVVEHVHVNAGGQAVIANTVTTGGRGDGL